MTLKRNKNADPDEDVEEDDPEEEEEDTGGDDDEDDPDAGEGDEEEEGEEDEGEEEDKAGKPKKGKPLSAADKKALIFAKDLAAGKPYAVKEAREHLERLGASGKPKKPAKASTDGDRPMTRREFEEEKAKDADRQRATGLFQNVDTLLDDPKWKGIIKAEDRDEIVELAYNKGLTVKQAMQLMPRFENRQRKAKARAKAQGGAPSGGSGGRTGGRDHGGNRMEKLRKDAKAAGPGLTPQRKALYAAQREEAQARKK